MHGRGEWKLMKVSSAVDETNKFVLLLAASSKIFGYEKKNIPVKAFLFILALVAISEQTLSQRKKSIAWSLIFGARADDKTDCYPAFVRAAAVLSKAGGAFW